MIVQQVEYVYVQIPQSALSRFEITPAGTNAAGVVNGYIKNTIALGQCNRRLISIEEWEKEQLNILDKNNN